MVQVEKTRTDKQRWESQAPLREFTIGQSGMSIHLPNQQPIGCWSLTTKETRLSLIHNLPLPCQSLPARTLPTTISPHHQLSRTKAGRAQALWQRRSINSVISPAHLLAHLLIALAGCFFTIRWQGCWYDVIIVCVLKFSCLLRTSWRPVRISAIPFRPFRRCGLLRSPGWTFSVQCVYSKYTTLILYYLDIGRDNITIFLYSFSTSVVTAHFASSQIL